MADSLDTLLSDYMTGILEVKIKSREMWITRQKHEESVGGKANKKSEPQLERLIALENDTKLQLMIDQKKTLDDLIKALDGTIIKQIIICRFKYRLSWDNVGTRVRLEQSAARKQYTDFKVKLLKDGLWADTLG